ncbi:MAG: hypothetical protein U0U25_03760 [Flavobacteriales bacterium]
MKKTLFTLALIGSAAAASAIPVQPAGRAHLQTLTKVETGTKTKAALGWTLVPTSASATGCSRSRVRSRPQRHHGILR